MCVCICIYIYMYIYSQIVYLSVCSSLCVNYTSIKLFRKRKTESYIKIISITEFGLYIIYIHTYIHRASPVAQMVKNLPAV